MNMSFDPSCLSGQMGLAAGHALGVCLGGGFEPRLWSVCNNRSSDLAQTGLISLSIAYLTCVLNMESQLTLVVKKDAIDGRSITGLSPIDRKIFQNYSMWTL